MSVTNKLEMYMSMVILKTVITEKFINSFKLVWIENSFTAMENLGLRLFQTFLNVLSLLTVVLFAHIICLSYCLTQLDRVSPFLVVYFFYKVYQKVTYNSLLTLFGETAKSSRGPYCNLENPYSKNCL